MPSLPSTKPFEPMQAETVEERFRRLESQWITDTGHLSSSTKIIGHPAFQEIIALGLAIVPFMMRDLEEKPRLWVWALPEITSVDPVSESDRGNIAKMSEAWLRWGRANGYKW
jgi:hypothetical protein